MYRSIPKPPMPPSPAQTLGHLTFLKNFGQIPRHVASLDGQMPHPLELQRGSNRLFKCTYSVLLHIMCGYQCDKAVNKNDTREVI